MIYQMGKVVAKSRARQQNGGCQILLHEERVMAEWKIAAVQMDCQFGEKSRNLEVVRTRLSEAVKNEAKLVVFPECALTGYCFTSKAEALPHTEPIPGPATEALGAHCRRLGGWAAVGLLELDGPSGNLF